ncbi:MAG: glycerophosphodiester phosphodiesterase [Thermodesulfobacteriota bacterium]
MTTHLPLFLDSKTCERPLFPMLLAHRGAMAEAPENTAAAFEKALFWKTDGIEFDVQLSADGIPVVFHDDDLFRVTGINGPVSDYPFETLKTFDYGNWFSEAFSDTSLMRLEDVLRTYAHRTNLMIELKTGPSETAGFPERKRRLVQDAVGMIMALVPKKYLGKMHVLSFDQEALRIAHETAPGLKYILNIEPGDHVRTDGMKHDPITYGYGLHFGELDKSVVRRAHDAGKKIMSYPCNTIAEVAAALDAGADFLLTDDPAAVAPYFFKQCETEGENQ